MTKAKEKIIDAAVEIVQYDGVLELTLEKVAKRAGISKGGLLYHFPSKDALIQGMVEQLIENYVVKIDEHALTDTVHKGKWTRAFIEETFIQSTPIQNKSAGLLAALAVNPSLLQPIQKAYSHWQNQMENDGLNQVDAAILRLAADGLWFSELFNLAPLESELRKQVLAALMERTKGE